MKPFTYMLKNAYLFAFLLCLVSFTVVGQDFVQYDGKITDATTGDALVFATVNVKDTNISTVTNSEGAFTLKIPANTQQEVVLISLIGYEGKEVALSSLKTAGNAITLTPAITQLNEVSVTAFANAEALVRAVFRDKALNNLEESVVMTAFYRETIKRRRRNVSLTEAVVDLYKQPVSSKKNDVVALHKARKSTDYRRLDTITMKLQGGPFSVLYVDVMKYPEYIFTDRTISYYDFTFGAPSTANDRPVYVVNFKQKGDIPPPGYQGKLYIDAQSLALTSATYSLVIGDAKEAGALFVKKKPRDTNVYPTNASYRVDYREKNGKWYYGYGSVQLSFKVAKKRRLFNQIYYLSSEMAVTDWVSNKDGQVALVKDRLKPTVIITDAVSGFSDPDFWGPYNVIEPEKSIESAIGKIKRKIERTKG